jgi:hypothetical protein
MMRLALSLATATVLGLPIVQGPAFAQTFDGDWEVKIVTVSGTCPQTGVMRVAIAGGAVQQASSSSGVSSAKGEVTSSGKIQLQITKGFASANASGQLASNRGAGTWTVETLGCAGQWNATRV